MILKEKIIDDNIPIQSPRVSNRFFLLGGSALLEAALLADSSSSASAWSSVTGSVFLTSCSV